MVKINKRESFKNTLLPQTSFRTHVLNHHSIMLLSMTCPNPLATASLYTSPPAPPMLLSPSLPSNDSQLFTPFNSSITLFLSFALLLNSFPLSGPSLESIASARSLTFGLVLPKSKSPLALFSE